MRTPVRPRNDVGQYDDLAGQWWRPRGALAPLNWVARARAGLVPPATRDGAILVDLGCGGGLLAPHLAGKGYTLIGVDLVASALEQAARHGFTPVRADVARLPLVDGCADVVSAGEIFEHVTDLPTVVAEACRMLRPGGLLIVDTLNDTALSRFLVVTVAERLRRVPRGLHDPDLFVDPGVLAGECARHGVTLVTHGLRPAAAGLLRWLVTNRGEVAMVSSRSSAVLYQGRGIKEAPR
jgi:2-polyprenyl-6-hydroxyphenyl methylase/3-demethylubiquinone-9 3-methyltransferase